MSIIFHHRLTLAITALVLLSAGCASEPPQTQPGPLDEPVDAFESVGQPQRPVNDRQGDRDELSTDIERLQDARKAYRLEQERLEAQTRRRQAECRADPDSREVPIKDGSGDPDATYCRPAEEVQDQ